MGLNFPGEWMFAGTDEVPAMPADLAMKFYGLLSDIAAGATEQWGQVEQFKTRFGATATSSELSWAESDLMKAMERRSANSVAFIESLWRSLVDARAAGLKTPSDGQINSLLREHGVPFQIKGTELVQVRVDALINVSPERLKVAAALPYELGAEIGRGGFGIVYRATRETSAATFEYALKLLDPSPFVDRDKAVQRFQREVRAIQALQHRAIVPCVDAGIDHMGRPYLVMQHIKGGSLRDATEGCEAVIALRLMAEVLHGLEHAHEQNVLHRDLKPNNILVRSSDGQPIILDFGMAFIIDDLDAKSLTTAAVGSAGYIPSEVLADPRLRTPLHDVFSCGVITYELIARRRPDPQQYVALANQWPELRPLDGVLIRALGPAHARYASPAALRQAILDAIPA